MWRTIAIKDLNSFLESEGVELDCLGVRVDREVHLKIPTQPG